MEGKAETNSGSLEEHGYERWSPLSTSPPPARIWGKAALMLGFAGLHIGFLINAIDMFPGLPIGDADVPAILGNAMAFSLIAIARLRSRRDWLAVTALGLLFGLGGLAATLLAALAMAWLHLSAPEFLTDFVLAVLFAFPVYRFAFPWCERRGLVRREDWVQETKKPCAEDEP